MKTLQLSVPELAFVAGTRALAGAGVALLLGDRLTAPTRRTVGWTLLAIGVATTVPIALTVIARRR